MKNKIIIKAYNFMSYILKKSSFYIKIKIITQTRVLKIKEK